MVSFIVRAPKKNGLAIREAVERDCRFFLLPTEDDQPVAFRVFPPLPHMHVFGARLDVRRVAATASATSTDTLTGVGAARPATAAAIIA